MVEHDDDSYQITDWVAPWVDGGERLSAYIYGIKEVAEDDNEGDHDLVWQIGMVMMCRQLENDILMAKIARKMGLNVDTGN
jgi:hypothetical protein